VSENTQKDKSSATKGRFWTEEKLNVWVRVGVPTLATIMLGFSTIFIDQGISRRAEREQSSRLYTELISRREQASSSLRKDMFGTILRDFLDRGAGSPEIVGSKDLDQDLMKLELLALNFGESLSLGPLFAMMHRRIRTPDSYNTKMQRLDRPKLQSRLESLARRVADAQRSSLAGKIDEFQFLVPTESVVETKTHEWPQTDDDFTRACLTLGRVQRRFFLTMSNMKTDARTIDVDMLIQTLALSDEAPQVCVDDLIACVWDMPERCIDYQDIQSTKADFTLDPFNLPLIDNALLSHDQRFAVIMRRFATGKNLQIVGVLFPGAYAGRRDKLTLDQAIDALKGRIE